MNFLFKRIEQNLNYLPALPRLCLALAIETGSGNRVSMLFSVSKFFSFILPESTTNTTSSIVIDVSAIDVAIIIFLTPSGGLLNTTF